MVNSAGLAGAMLTSAEVRARLTPALKAARAQRHMFRCIIEAGIPLLTPDEVEELIDANRLPAGPANWRVVDPAVTIQAIEKQIGQMMLEIQRLRKYMQGKETVQ